MSAEICVTYGTQGHGAFLIFILKHKVLYLWSIFGAQPSERVCIPFEFIFHLAHLLLQLSDNSVSLTKYY